MKICEFLARFIYTFFVKNTSLFIIIVWCDSVNSFDAFRSLEYVCLYVQNFYGVIQLKCIIYNSTVYDNLVLALFCYYNVQTRIQNYGTAIRRRAHFSIKGNNVFTRNSIGDFAVLLDPRMTSVSQRVADDFSVSVY